MTVTRYISAPENVRFCGKDVVFYGEEEDIFPYREILFACIEQTGMNGAPGEILKVEEISEDTRGKLLIGNRFREVYEIRTEHMERTAGQILIELSEYCPWLWIGDNPCIETDDKKVWDEMKERVSLMFKIVS